MPREVFLRADGRVRYVRVSRRQQMAAAAIVTGFAGWTLASTASLVVGAFFLTNQSAQRHEVDAAYAQLRERIAASRERFAQIAQALGSQQEFLLDLVHDGATPAADAGAGGAAAIPPAGDPVEQTLTETSAQLAIIASNDQALRQGLGTVERHVAALDEARERAATARDRYALALQATTAQLATQHQQVASLTDDVTVLEFEFARSVGQSTAVNLAVQMRDIAAAAHHEHPDTINGSIDWKVVEERRTARTIVEDRVPKPPPAGDPAANARDARCMTATCERSL